jgi:hypothetical protein
MSTATRDGRNVDERLGVLQGEAADVEVGRPLDAFPLQRHGPSRATDRAAQESPTYYELPVLKAPVWIATIPTDFYVGGVTGGALALGAAVQLLDDERPALLRACRWMGAVGTVASAGLLIADLGRPSRFLNMLRVFRPTSPMSVGSWVLAATGATATLAVLGAPRGPLARGATTIAGALGLALAGYTGVLLANTAVPLWRGARRAMPPLFLGSGLASAAALLELVALPARDRALARRVGVLGKVLELSLSRALERELDGAPRARMPLEEGATGALWRAAKALTSASLLLAVLPRAPRRLRTLGAALGTAGALAMRFGLFHGGKRSARDPRATFEGQRARMEADRT